VIQIKIPPLRERKEDILAIALSFLKKRCSQQGKPLKTLPSETIRLLQSAPWPGNVRELLNVLENVVLMSEERVIYPNALPEDFLKGVSGRSIAAQQDLEALIQKIIELGNYSKARPLMPQIEAILAKRMVDHVPGKSTAAGLLGITKPTLYARLNDYKRMQ
jgi:DNA-binding NtrC family response regulator